MIKSNSILFNEGVWKEKVKESHYRKHAQENELARYLQAVDRKRGRRADDDVEALIEGVGAGDERAQKSLANSYRHLVVRMSRRYAGKYPIMTPLEIVKAGERGLTIAIERAPQRLGASGRSKTFSRFAEWWIRRTIQNTYSSLLKSTGIDGFSGRARKL